jgi:hypothetical protein
LIRFHLRQFALSRLPMPSPLRNLLFSGRVYRSPNAINRKIGAVESAQIAPCTLNFIEKDRRVVTVAVVLIGKGKNFRRAEIDAVAAPLAAIPVDENDSSKFATSDRFCNFGHLNLWVRRSYRITSNPTYTVRAQTSVTYVT